jgi:hypothetical protein
MNRQDWAEHAFFQGMLAIERAWRYGSRNEVGGTDDTMQLGRRVEQLAADLLAGRGAIVSLTRHKEHFDIQANGAHIEVKSARWDGRRWQWNMRASQADVYLLACVADNLIQDWFVIPADAIEDRRHVAIWNADPASYAGQWAAYHEAWDLIDRAIAEGAHPWQMPLLQEEYS